MSTQVRFYNETNSVFVEIDENGCTQKYNILFNMFDVKKYENNGKLLLIIDEVTNYKINYSDVSKSHPYNHNTIDDFLDIMSEWRRKHVNTVNVKEEIVPTGSHFRTEGKQVSIPSGVGNESSFTFVWNYPISVLNIIVEPRTEHISDRLNTHVSPNSQIGYLTENSFYPQNEFNVNSTVIQYLQLGYKVKFNDNIDINIKDDLNDCLEIDPTTNTITTETNSTKDYFKYPVTTCNIATAGRLYGTTNDGYTVSGAGSATVLTSTTNTLLILDGLNAFQGYKVLVKDEVDELTTGGTADKRMYNGVYTVTDAGHDGIGDFTAKITTVDRLCGTTNDGYTYDGIDTITNASTLAKLRIDEKDTADGNFILVKNEVDETTTGGTADKRMFNGIWSVIEKGSGTIAWILKREPSFVTKANASVNITDGLTQKDTHWILNTPDPIILDTTPLSFISLVSSQWVLTRDLSFNYISHEGSMVTCGDTQTNYGFKIKSTIDNPYTMDTSIVDFEYYQPTKIFNEIQIVRDVYISNTNSMNIGSSKIGGSYVPKSTIIKLYYKNNEGSAKNFEFRVEYLY